MNHGKSNYKPFKYATEAALILYLGHYLLCQQKDFKIVENDPFVPYYNIYLICQRNRITIDPDTIRFNKETISMETIVHDKNHTFSVPVSFSINCESPFLKFECEYPHDQLTIHYEDKTELMFKASALLDSNRENILPDPKFLDLEVLYVGQTQRVSNTPILDRLKDHKTLQNIYSETLPDKDVYLILGCFESKGIIVSRGTVRTQKKYEEVDNKRLKAFMSNQLIISNEQRINLAEATLIKYFDPIYNKTYKNSFPNETHVSYKNCYELDLNAVTIEVNIAHQLFSEKAPTSKAHNHNFRFVTDKERRDLFDYSVGFDKDI